MMKRVSALLCLAALSTSLLAGCASSNSDGGTSAGAADGTVSTPVTTPVDMDIVALKGPTGMGLVQFMNQAQNGELTDNNYNFTIAAAAEEITAQITKEDGVEIATVPANLASILYNNTDGGIDVLAINTLGVLYLVENSSTDTDAEVQTDNSIESLRGKTIYASGKGLTPEYTLNYILSENGIDPTTDVTIEWKSEHTECLSALLANENAVAMLPQPFVTTALTQSDSIRVMIDLNEEWDALQANSETPSALITGVVVARKDFIEENPEAVSSFLDHYEDSVEFVNNNVEEAAKLIDSFDIVPEAVAVKALPACNITFVEGEEMKEQLSGYLQVLYDQNPQTIGGEMPADDFYYSR